MRTTIAAIFTICLAAVAGFLLTWSYQHHRGGEHEEEHATAEEGEKEKPDERRHGVVKLSEEKQKLAGLELATAKPATLARSVTAYGRVLDPSSLIASDAELSSARAALASSRAASERDRALFDENRTISRKTLETSEAQFRADDIRVRSLQRRLLVEWGPHVSELDEAGRAQLLDDLAAGRIAFARVEVPLADVPAAAPTSATVALLNAEDTPIKAAAVYPAAAVDVRTQAQAFILQIPAANLPLRPGAALVAHLALPGGTQAGSLIPRGAVVRHEGRTWVYVPVGDDAFQRRPVSGEPIESGWFAGDGDGSGIKPGSRIVSVGAQTLLAEELKSALGEE